MAPCLHLVSWTVSSPDKSRDYQQQNYISRNTTVQNEAMLCGGNELQNSRLSRGDVLEAAVSLRHDNILEKSAAFSADSTTPRQYPLFVIHKLSPRAHLALISRALFAAFLLASLSAGKFSLTTSQRRHLRTLESINRAHDNRQQNSGLELFSPISSARSLCSSNSSLLAKDLFTWRSPHQNHSTT